MVCGVNDGEKWRRPLAQDAVCVASLLSHLGISLLAKENCVHAAALQVSQVTLGLSSGLDCQLLKDAAAVDLLIIFHLSVYRT